MARQRNVFPRDELSHLWAIGAQDSARDKQGNFYFSGGSLYSYGSHFVIAHILDSDAGQGFRRVIWNDATYGSTTSKHQSIAWRALSRQQRENRLHVPALNQDTAREIERSLIAKRVPLYAATLLGKIRELVSSTQGKRHGSGPFMFAINRARDYQATAQAFYARAGKRYPLPVLPADHADIPADKAARAAWVLTFARVLIQGEYTKHVARAVELLADTRAEMVTPAHLDAERALRFVANAFHVAQRCEVEAGSAQSAYMTLHAGKRSAQVNRIVRDVAPLIADLKARKESLEREQMIEQLDSVVRRFYFAQRNATVNRALTLPGYVSRTLEWVQTLRLPADDVRAVAAQRMLRIDAAASAKRAAKSAAESFNVATSYDPRHLGDAKRCYVQGLDHVQQVRRYAPRMADYLLRDLQTGIAHASERLATIDADLRAQEAGRIAAWISGTSNDRPRYEAGTYARIVGQNIETNRGAVVPIAHACRLARVFDRIVRAGGQSWPDGSGPMVGHYRVNHIGADGALIIGCHEFNPAEAQRLRDLLNACAECQSITEGATA